MLPGFDSRASENRARIQRCNRKLNFLKLYAAPDKPREGDVVLADGATWNPGKAAALSI